MACNAAVSITKMAVTDEQIRKLLTPEVVQAVVSAVLTEAGATGVNAGTWGQGSYVSARARDGQYLSVIVNPEGTIEVEAGRDQQRAAALGTAIATALQQAGEARYDSLLAQAILRLTGKAPVVAQAQAEENGQTFQATVLRVRF